MVPSLSEVTVSPGRHKNGLPKKREFITVHDYVSTPCFLILLFAFLNNQHSENVMSLKFAFSEVQKNGNTGCDTINA